MPLAMPGPKMPRPTSDNAASTIAIASSMVGVAPPKPDVNSEKSVEPMPMMTPSTSTLMPDEMTLPSKRSAMNADLPNRPNGITTKQARGSRLGPEERHVGKEGVGPVRYRGEPGQ